MLREVNSPLHLAAEKALRDLENHSRIELLDIESLPIPSVDNTPEAKQKSRRVYITYERMLEIGATSGCKGCDNDTSSHSKECIERFERAFGKADESGDVAEPAPIEYRTRLCRPLTTLCFLTGLTCLHHHPSERICPNMKMCPNVLLLVTMNLKGLQMIHQLLECQLLPQYLVTPVHFCPPKKCKS